ncbi:MAG: trigger factor [Phycisphaeraceae bacterium]|nr:trigger factor [Phycisphaeraceae bacterium]
MSDSAATLDRPNQVTVTDAGPSKKKLAISIPAATVSEKLRGSVDLLMDQASLPGFRRGKAPRWLVEKQFGSAVRKEAKNELMTSAVTQAIEDHKLKVLGSYLTPESAVADLADGKDFTFEVEVEVLPEFELPELKGITVKKPLIPVTDEMVAEEVNKICINEGTLEPRDKAEPGDYVTGHAVMKGADGTEFYNLKGAVIQVPTKDKKGKGMILGIVVDDFAKQIGSPAAGDTLTVKAKGPEHHEVEGVRNADLTVTFEVERVDRIIPAKIEDIVAAMGIESEESMRSMIRQRMEVRVKIQQQTAMHQQLAKHLVDSTKMDLPERTTAQQAQRTLERRRLELMYRGVEPVKIEEHIAELRQASGEAAATELKLFFLLHKASEALSVTVSDAEINQRIVQMAMQRNERPDRLRQELIKNNQISGIYTQLRDHKTLDAILESATVSEVTLEEFNKSVKGDGLPTA